MPIARVIAPLVLLFPLASLVASCGGEAFSQGSADASVDGTIGSDAGACVPKLCPALGKECGPADDGCGKALDCGPCTTANTACQEGKCVCKPKSCADQGAQCGTVPDGCGNTLLCPPCPTNEFCGGGGDHKCGSTPCTPRTCGAKCGIISDGCGSTLDCRDLCLRPKTCGGGGVANECGCTGKTCAQLGWACGSGSDNCNQPINCPACPNNQQCNQQTHQCVCVPATTCASMGWTCGTFVDECGATQKCGPDPVREPTLDGNCKDGTYTQAYQCLCAAVDNGPREPNPPAPFDGGTIACPGGPTPPLPQLKCVAIDQRAAPNSWCCQ
jgi:hypothetical protein